VLTREISCQVG
jgi:hypothetical protein